MPKNVLITPATGLVEFKNDSGNVDATFQLDTSGNLNIANPGGNLNIGNLGANVYIGDGTNSADVIFEQNGAVRALTGKTLTLGQSDSNIAIVGNFTTPSQIVSTVTTGTSPLVIGSATRVANLNAATAGTADTLLTGRTIALTGDVTYTSGAFNGSANVTGTATLASVGTAGTYAKVTTDSKGRVTSGTALAVADIPELTLEKLPSSAFKRSVQCATTANITLSGTQTIDGIAVVVGDRVLVKNQTTASQNGIYVVAASTWARAADADSTGNIASGVVNVDNGTLNGSDLWTNTFKGTNILGTTAMNWYEVLYNTGTWGISVTGNAATVTNGVYTTGTQSIGGIKTFTGSVNSSALAVAATTIDCSLGNYFTKTISANTTFIFSNPPASGTAYGFTLELTHTSGSITWPSSVQWSDSIVPTLTTGKTHLFVFITDDGGTRWRGAAIPNYTT